nr:uncharacterized protein LOC123764771 isoform X2 [Procambarus clarkii]
MELKIGALLNSLMLAVVLVILSLLSSGTNSVTSLEPSPRPIYSDDDDYADLQEEAKNVLEIFRENIDLAKIVIYILFGTALLLVITSSMLIHGVRRNRRGLLVPFIIHDMINVIIFFGFAVVVLVVFGTHTVIISSAISIFAAILIQIYFLLVVISQYQALGLLRMHEEISMK